MHAMLSVARAASTVLHLVQIGIEIRRGRSILGKPRGAIELRKLLSESRHYRRSANDSVGINARFYTSLAPSWRHTDKMLRIGSPGPRAAAIWPDAVQA